MRCGTSGRLLGHPLYVRWFTSDLHFGHANILHYCERPFRDVGSMNAGLVAAWNTVVGPDDEVWILGDVAMGRLDDTLRHVAQLTGVKHLVLGNHDRPFSAKRGRSGWVQRYRELGGFAEIHSGEVELSLADGTPVKVCHFPYEGDSGERDRFLSERPMDDGRWLLHGHVHERWLQRGRMINVGVDAWAGRPVGEDRLLELIRTGETERTRLGWN